MHLDPGALLMLAVVIAVSGWVARGLMASWSKLHRDEKSSGNSVELEERLRRIEEAMSGVIMDVTTIKEKERFMARLQASAASREAQAKEMKESEMSPLMTQSIPVIPRVSR